MKYKFLFDRKSGQYKGITYDDKADNTTSVRPIFSAGFVTCWCFDSNRWKLVPDESFFVQMADVELIKAVDTRIINAIGMHYEAISESLKVYDAAMIARFEMVLKEIDNLKGRSEHTYDRIGTMSVYVREVIELNTSGLGNEIRRATSVMANQITASITHRFSLRGRWERLKAEISRWFRPL